jgi:DNA transformation protein
MPVSASFKEHIAELLSPLGPVAIRRMFGGAGVSADGLTFAILAEDALYFKVDDVTRPKFEAEAMGPFTYASKSGEHALTSYMRCPPRLMDETDELLDWARAAMKVTRRLAGGAKAKPKANLKQKPTNAKPKPAKAGS